MQDEKLALNSVSMPFDSDVEYSMQFGTYKLASTLFFYSKIAPGSHVSGWVGGFEISELYFSVTVISRNLGCV